MNVNCDECPVLPRVEALEEANKQHGSTHREMYDRLRALETQTAVQENKLDTILRMLNELTEKVDALEAKPGRRWDKLAETVLVAIATGVVCFLLGRMGL